MSLVTQGVKRKEEAYQFGKRYVKNRGKFSEVKPAKNKKYDVVDSTDRIAYAVQIFYQNSKQPFNSQIVKLPFALLRKVRIEGEKKRFSWHLIYEEYFHRVCKSFYEKKNNLTSTIKPYGTRKHSSYYLVS